MDVPLSLLSTIAKRNLSNPDFSIGTVFDFGAKHVYPFCVGEGNGGKIVGKKFLWGDRLGDKGLGGRLGDKEGSRFSQCPDCLENTLSGGHFT